MNSKTIIIAGALLLLLTAMPAGSAAAEDFIRGFEGIRLSAYPDSGSYSIGYGSQYNYDAGRPVRSGDKITPETAAKWLKLKLAEIGQLIRGKIKTRLNNNQVVALTSLIYNIGNDAFESSTLLRKINAGESKQSVAAEFDRWIHSDGSVNQDLVHRRAQEKALYLS